MDDGFLEAWVNSSHRVLGKSLHPLCLSDLLNLYAVESPICSAFEPEHDSVSDALMRDRIPNFHLQIAAVICSSYTPFDYLSAGWLKAIPREVWKSRGLFYNFDKEFHKFVTYVHDYLTVPEVWDTGLMEDGQIQAGAPWPLKLAAYLSSVGHVPHECRQCGLDQPKVEHSCIWKMPIGKAMWMSASISEMKGTVQIPDEVMKAIAEEVAEHQKSKESNESP